MLETYKLIHFEDDQQLCSCKDELAVNTEYLTDGVLISSLLYFMPLRRDCSQIIVLE